MPYFEIFQPNACSYWVRQDQNKQSGYVSQQRWVGHIDAMPKDDEALFVFEYFEEWYQSEYHRFHQEKPELASLVPLTDRGLMIDSLEQGLLFGMKEAKETIGLIAGDRQTFMGKPSVYLNEILVAQSHRGKGYGHQLLARFVNRLAADYFICHIDAANITSTRTALRSGQTVFSQEVMEPMSLV